MGNKLHGRATTTPAIRKKIQESTETIKALAQRYGINHNTVKNGKNARVPKIKNVDHNHAQRHLQETKKLLLLPLGNIQKPLLMIVLYPKKRNTSIDAIFIIPLSQAA